MATNLNVTAGSRWCRDCGDPITTFKRDSTCPNLASQGKQLTPQDHCENLTANRRHYCEQCRFEEPGPGICPSCRKRPLDSLGIYSVGFRRGGLPDFRLLLIALKISQGSAL